MIDIQVFKTDYSEYNFNYFQDVVSHVISEEQKNEGELVLMFCSDDYLLEINNKYLNHEYYTDIITFDYTDQNIISGELLISIDRIKENSEKFSVSFLNEITRVVIHGVLHLCGYNDKTDDEKTMIRNLENKYLKKFF